MERLTAFVQEHIADDTSRLILNRTKWPEIDMDLAVNCIESRRKLRGKVQEWYDEPGLIFPRKLSAEQCSSSATGKYKAELAEKIATQAGNDGEFSHPTQTEILRRKWKIADLTGGLGVDSWFFSERASEVLYCEMLPELCKAATHNFSVLEAGNITVLNAAVCDSSETSPLASLRPSDKRDNTELKDRHIKSEEPSTNLLKLNTSIFRSPTEILSGFNPDIVYIDPARRGEGGRKVFLIEECTPDVLRLKDEIFGLSRHMLLKLSPMADISMVCERLGKKCREVHVVATGGECKELLVWMDREWDEEYTVHAVELHRDGSRAVFSFRPSEERIAGQICNDVSTAEGRWADNACLFEPGKALMKAGAYNLISERFGIRKLGRSTHYYIYDTLCRDKHDCIISGNEHKEQISVEDLQRFGKVFRIISCSPLDKRSIKAAGKAYPHSEVTARNISMDTDTLRKKTGVTSGDDAHIFGLKSDSEGALLFITTPLA